MNIDSKEFTKAWDDKKKELADKDFEQDVFYFMDYVWDEYYKEVANILKEHHPHIYDKWVETYQSNAFNELLDEFEKMGVTLT